MSTNLKGGLFHYCIYFLMGIILLAGLAMIYPSWRQRDSLKRQEAELIARIELKKAEIERLKENQRRFKTDPTFVESIARKANLVYPGEYVFIFDE